MQTTHSPLRGPSPRRRAALALGTAAIILTLAPALASAEDFCVQKSGEACAAGATDVGGDLQAALTGAQLNGADGDTIAIGPGTYTGPFYAPISASEIVTIKGAGASTVLTSPNDMGKAVLGTGAGDMRISDLAVVLPGEPTMSGIRAAGRVERVSVSGPAGAGFRPAADATVQDSSADIPGGWGVYVPAPSSDVTVRRMTISAKDAVATLGANTSVRQSQLTATESGVYVNGGSMRIDDTVIMAGAGAGVWTTCSLTAGSQATLRNATVQGSVGVTGGCALGGAQSLVSIDSSIISGAAYDLCVSGANGGTATVESQYSWVGPTWCPNSNGTYSSGTGDIAGPAPLGADLRLAAGSAAIDAGNPAQLTGPFDAAGATRSVDGNGDGVARPDVGAYEFIPSVAADPVAGGGGAGAAGQPVPSPAPGASEQPLGPTPAAGAQVGLPARIDVPAALRRMLATGHGRSYVFAFPGAGRLSVVWTRGGRTLARGALTRRAAGPAKLRLRLTPVGRQAAHRGVATRVRARASFTPAGAAPVQVSRQVRGA